MGRTAITKPGVIRNPPPGTLLAVRAGEESKVVFDFENDNPESVASFLLEVTGLPAPNWTRGTGTEAGVMVAALGSGALSLTLTPPTDAEIDDYPFHLRVLCADEAYKEVNLLLRVEEGEALPVVASEPMPVVVATPTVSVAPVVQLSIVPPAAPPVERVETPTAPPVEKNEVHVALPVEVVEMKAVLENTPDKTPLVVAPEPAKKSRKQALKM